jgi:hypothetical protein
LKLSITSSDNPWALPDEQCPDIYFTSGYGAAAAISAGGRWEAVHWEDRIIVPCIVRSVDGRFLDAVSPYGYSGIYVAPDCSPQDLRQFWQRINEYWRELGMVAMFYRFRPFDQASVDAAAILDGLTLTYRADTVTVPVGHGPDQVWSEMEGRSRTAIRKAANAGLRGELRQATAADIAPGSSFRRLYEETMRRVASSTNYFFLEGYYEQLHTGLRDALMLAQVRDSDGTVVATSLVLAHRRLVHYHLAGSSVDGGRQGANNLLLWTILEWAADNGLQLVHLGGGLRRDDNLFRFKRSFGGERTPFSTGATVTDPASYDVLVHQRADQLGIATSQLLERGWFPAYRFGSDLL